MKTIITIIIAIAYCLLCSCGTVGLYTKNQAINKFCKQDSIIFVKIIHDTIKIKEEKADTIFTMAPCDSLGSDSVTVINGNVSSTFVRKGNKVKLSANYKGNSIPYQKPIKIALPCNCPPCPEPLKPTFWEKIILWAKNGLSLIGIVVLLVFGIRLLVKKLS
jgi:hypothetical protein